MDTNAVIYFDKQHYAHCAAQAFSSGRLIARPSVHRQLTDILRPTMLGRVEPSDYDARRASALDLLDRWIDDPALIYPMSGAFESDVSLFKILLKVLAYQKADEPLVFEVEVD